MSLTGTPKILFGTIVVGSQSELNMLHNDFADVTVVSVDSVGGGGDEDAADGEPVCVPI